jgi:hypothetical protein
MKLHPIKDIGPSIHRGGLRLENPEVQIEFSVDDLWELMLTKGHDFAADNKQLIEESETCGCFYCLSIFPASDVKEWVGVRPRAVCPFCGIDSVLPDKSEMLIDSMDTSATWTLFFLNKMHERWFSRKTAVSAKELKERKNEE